MKVCIEKTQDGKFSVYEEIEPATEMATENEGAEQKNAQPAPDMQSALMLAAKLLSSSENDMHQQAFDQGMAKAAPNMVM